MPFQFSYFHWGWRRRAGRGCYFRLGTTRTSCGQESLYYFPLVEVLRLDPVDPLKGGLPALSEKNHMERHFSLCFVLIAHSFGCRFVISALRLHSQPLGFGEEPALLSACR